MFGLPICKNCKRRMNSKKCVLYTIIESDRPIARNSIIGVDAHKLGNGQERPKCISGKRGFERNHIDFESRDVVISKRMSYQLRKYFPDLHL